MDLSLAFASCTGAALKLSISDPARPQNWELRRDGVLVKKGLLFAADTALNDLSLAPSHSYRYRAYRLDDKKIVDSSSSVIAVTGDTTSSAYAFEISYFGDGQSQFYDVFAVSDTEAYAVGYLFKRDSTGRMNDLYNGARWDGQKWTLIKIPVFICGGTTTTIAALTSVYCFGRSQNIYSDGGELIRYNGSTYAYDCYKLPSMHVYKMWGTQTSMYFVGSSGATALWDGTHYTLNPTGTTLDLTDIWGNDNEIWAVGGPPYNPTSTVQLCKENIWEDAKVLTHIGNRHVSSVWCDERGLSRNGFVGFAGNGVYYYDFGWKTPPDELMKAYLPKSYNFWFSAIRGSASNNVFAVGDYGIMLHYNGANWTFYPEVFDTSVPRKLYSVSVTRNMVFAVGDENTKGVIVTGRKK